MQTARPFDEGFVSGLDDIYEVIGPAVLARVRQGWPFVVIACGVKGSGRHATVLGSLGGSLEGLMPRLAKELLREGSPVQLSAVMVVEGDGGGRGDGGFREVRDLLGPSQDALLRPRLTAHEGYVADSVGRLIWSGEDVASAFLDLSHRLEAACVARGRPAALLFYLRSHLPPIIFSIVSPDSAGALPLLTCLGALLHGKRPNS